MQLLPEDRFVISSPYTADEALKALAAKTGAVRPRMERGARSDGKLFEGVVGETGFQIRHADPLSKVGTLLLQGNVDEGDEGCSILVTPSIVKQDKWLIFGSMAFLAVWAVMGIVLGGWVVLAPALVFAFFFVVIFRQIHKEAAALKAELANIFKAGAEERS